MQLPVFEPLAPSRVSSAFDHPAWIFELKHDGFRCLAYIADGRCELVSRRNNRYKRFDALKSALSKLKARAAILDGEIVCLDGEGRSLFNPLLYRRGDPCFYCFDLLWLNGRDLRQLPLVERKKRLRYLIEKSGCDRIIYAQHIEWNGTALYREVCARDLEGIVCKRRDGPYSLMGGQWLKALNPAYTQHEGRQEKFTAFRERVFRRVR